jgi:hypothetical protein
MAFSGGRALRASPVVRRPRGFGLIPARLFFKILHTGRDRSELPADNLAVPRTIHEPIPGVIQHVILRFVDHEHLMADDGCRSDYLKRLEKTLADSDWRALWYALMETHVHLALIAGNDSLASWLRPVDTGFAGYINRSGRLKGLKKLGPVFADRPKTFNFSAEKAGYLAAYLHNNPVRAGTVSDPAHSSWTSHRAYLGLEPAPAFLHVKEGLALTGNDDTAAGRLAFHWFVVSRFADRTNPHMSGAELASVRKAARERKGPVLEIVSPYFDVNKIRYEARARQNSHIRRAFAGTPQSVIEEVARITGITGDTLRSRSRDRSTSLARRVALLAWRRLDRPITEMCAALAISQPAGTQLVRRRPGWDLVSDDLAREVASRCREDRGRLADHLQNRGCSTDVLSPQYPIEIAISRVEGDKLLNC